MRAFNPNKQQLEAYQNGATMFIVPIIEWTLTKSKLQKDDEFFIQEDYQECKGEIFYGNSLTGHYSKIIDSSQMQEHQSRYKDVCLNVEIKRVQDISHNEGEIYAIYPEAHKDGYDNFIHGFNEKYLDGKYEDNPYVFLITFKGLSNNT